MHKTDLSFEQRMQRIEALVQRIEECSDPAAQDAAREMIRTLLELHAVGMSKMLELLSQTTGDADAVLDAWRRDDLVRNVLLLHDLHPEDTATRVRQALEQVRPYLDSHGGGVELLEASADVVRLRMKGSCEGCPSSTATLKSLIETAIYDAAPEVAAIEVEGLEPAGAVSGLVQLQISASS
ncbi:MAG: NifU family protein [Planctomycetes bacterium]|nr:NifU family protein [Planctomycetota bacterium]